MPGARSSSWTRRRAVSAWRTRREPSPASESQLGKCDARRAPGAPLRRSRRDRHQRQALGTLGADPRLHETYTVDAWAVPTVGTWKLRVTDGTPGFYDLDAGHLQRWSLTF
ncbi:proprotein convertase P-domain-containing protein [Micromonospora cremea]|uniref:proprotein convertase P-domain-containing protein n=1 Tax=Micromonospora cremea TaxID=709881 RepID=UPI001AD84FBD